MRLIVEEDEFLKRVAESCAERGSFDKIGKVAADDAATAAYLETDELFNSFIRASMTKLSDGGSTDAPSFQELQQKHERPIASEKSLYRHDLHSKSSEEDRLRSSAEPIVVRPCPFRYLPTMPRCFATETSSGFFLTHNALNKCSECRVVENPGGN